MFSGSNTESVLTIDKCSSAFAGGVKGFERFSRIWKGVTVCGVTADRSKLKKEAFGFEAQGFIQKSWV